MGISMETFLFPTVVKSGRSALIISLRGRHMVYQKNQNTSAHVSDNQDVSEKIQKLTEEHKKLDRALSAMLHDEIANPINIKRIKKHKLFLKDTIVQLKNKLQPDIIA